MLAVPIVNSFGWSFCNQTGAAFAPGTSVVPGTSNAEGSWTQVASSANIASDVYYVMLQVSGGTTNGQIKNHLLDLGIDPAGGTSYVAWMSNLICGTSSIALNGGRWFHFPCCIPAGSSIAVRVQGSNSTPGTVRVLAYFYGKRSAPELWPGAAYSETIGTITNSAGVIFTPTDGSFGSWTSLGTTVKPLRWWQLGYGIDDATLGIDYATRVQLAFGDATNKHLLTDFITLESSAEFITTPLQSPCQWHVPAGATLYVRGWAINTPNSNYHAAAVGFGG